LFSWNLLRHSFVKFSSALALLRPSISFFLISA